MSKLYEGLNRILPSERILQREPMSRHTTFRTGGEVAYLLRVSSGKELGAVVNCLQATGVPWLVLGRGSNVLVSDRGYDGAILQLTGDFEDIDVNGELLEVGAGAALAAVAVHAQEHGLSGLEFASGIPGSVGGALVMNAGAFGGEMSQVCESARVLDPNGGTVTELDRAALSFGYRESCIKGSDRIILSARLRLRRAPAQTVLSKMEDLRAKRLSKQPLEYPSAGSTFKRQSGEGLYAGKLIEEAGLSGMSIGGAAVSGKHCGFIINKGDATSSDIYSLICEVRRLVEEASGVRLEPEILMLGDF